MAGGELFGLALLVVSILVAIASTQNGIQALDDPANTSVVYLHQLAEIAGLSGSGTWLVTIYRQSGNVHSQTRIQGSASAALSAATSTFRRAKIGEIAIKTNSSDRLQFARLFHNHRGSNEGKKVGAALIVREG